MNIQNLISISAFVLATLVTSTVATSYGMNTVVGRYSEKDYIKVRGKTFFRNGTQLVISSFSTIAATFDQCMDHNDASCSQTWSQRYWVNQDYDTDKAGPTFFMLGAEGNAEGSVDDFYYTTYAQKYDATLVCLEHRFYGESYPTRDTSIPSLQLLTSQQALADASNFIKFFKTQYGLTTAKTVVFGGSYGGNLAAWFRQKYPSDVNVAVASSGPLLAKFDMTEYMQKVSEVIQEINPTCYNAIYSAFSCMEGIVHGTDTSCSPSVQDKSNLPSALGFCYSLNFDDESQKQGFFNNLAMSDWASNYPGTEFTPKCVKLVAQFQSNSDPIAAYAAFLQQVNKTTGPCPTNNGVQSLSEKPNEVLDFINSDAGIQSGAAGWYWQTCYEFGYYQTADPVYKLFGTDFGPMTYVSECASQFGADFTSDYIQGRVGQSNSYYKGLQYDGTCTIFVNGKWDPWSTLGITDASQTSTNNSVVLIPKAEHCGDMGWSQDPDMLAGQQQISTLIGHYLNNASC